MSASSSLFLSSLSIERCSSHQFTRHDLLRAEDALQPVLLANLFDCFPQWQSVSRDIAASLCAREGADGGESATYVYAECSANDGCAGLATPRYYGGERFLSYEDSPGSQLASPASASLNSAASQAARLSSRSHPQASEAPSHQETDANLPSPTERGEAGLSSDTVPPRSGTRTYGAAAGARRPETWGSPNIATTPSTVTESAGGAPLFSEVGGIDIIDDEGFLRNSLLSLRVAALQSRKAHQKKAQQQQQQEHLTASRESATATRRRRSVSARAYTTVPQGFLATTRSVSPDTVSTGSFSMEGYPDMTRRPSAMAPDLIKARVRRNKLPLLSLRDAQQVLRDRMGFLKCSESRSVGSRDGALDLGHLQPSAAEVGENVCEETVQQDDPRSHEDTHVKEAGVEETRKDVCFPSGVTPTVSGEGNASDSVVNASFSASNVALRESAFLLRDALRNEAGALYVKAPLASMPELLGTLQLPALTCSDSTDLHPHATSGATAASSHDDQSNAHKQWNTSARHEEEAQYAASSSASALNALLRMSDDAHGLFSSQNFFAGIDQTTETNSAATATATAATAAAAHGAKSLPPFQRCLPVNVAVPSPLVLKPGAYCAFILLAEEGAGTRAHVNVNGSHAWHVLLSGRKQWRMVHPLDKHLVTDDKTGKLADLFQPDPAAFPHIRHARVYAFVQEAGEAVFVPADAVHEERTISPLDNTSQTEMKETEAWTGSVALLMDFMDASCYMSFLKHTRANAILQSPCNTESLLPEVMHITTVDLVLFDNNVYPSFRGKHRAYRPEDKVDALVLRGMSEFSQVRMPCSELGARLELEALQSCFSFLGEAMLNEYDPPRYVVGVPKGYLVSGSDHRLILYYFVEPFSLKEIRECLQHHYIQQRRHRRFQYYECKDVTMPAIRLFRSTISHQGRIPNYVPLSVLFNQIWPFERDLCRKMVSLPHIILDKTYHPLGFIRPGSVWHYSRFDVQGKPAALTSADETAKEGGSLSTLSNKQFAEVAEEETEGGVVSSFGHIMTERESLEDQPGGGWCRTFLFYCSPLLDTPVALHPVQTDSTLQTAEAVAESSDSGVDETRDRGSDPPFLGDASVSDANTDATAPSPPSPQHAPKTCKRSTPKFSPRILEFAWNANRLEEYGLVSLLEFDTNAIAEMKRKILTDPSFERFESFVQNHCLRAINHTEETNIEKVMSVVLWFMCRPGVVGFTFGAVHGIDPEGGDEAEATTTTAAMVESEVDLGGADGSTEQRRTVLARRHNQAMGARRGLLSRASTTTFDQVDGNSSPAPSYRASVVASPTDVTSGAGIGFHSDAAVDEGNGLAIIDQWDTVCLTATAASAFLSCVRCSSYASIATRLCNWLCDRPEEAGPDRERSLFEDMEDVICHGDAEEQAVVYEVMKIKRRSLLQRDKAIHELGSAADAPSAHVASQPMCVRHPETCGFVNAEKLQRAWSFYHRVETACASSEGC